MAAKVADDLFLDLDGDDDDPFAAVGDVSYLSFSETLEEPEYAHPTPDDPFAAETLVASSPFSFDSDPNLDLDLDLDLDLHLSSSRSPPFWDCLDLAASDDLAPVDGFDWEEIADGGGTNGAGDGDGFLDEREMLSVMEGMESEGDESGFSDELPFVGGSDGFDEEGDELDGAFRSVGWEVLPVPLAGVEDDDFEVLPGQVGDVVGGAPPASRAAVERLPVVALGVEEAARGCAVCKDCIAPGELATRLPCEHCYHGLCIQPWLAIRNTCPVCRYELPTDDPEYERWRAQRRTAGGSTAQLATPVQA